MTFMNWKSWFYRSENLIASFYSSKPWCIVSKHPAFLKPHTAFTFTHHSTNNSGRSISSGSSANFYQLKTYCGSTLCMHPWCSKHEHMRTNSRVCRYPYSSFGLPWWCPAWKCGKVINLDRLLLRESVWAFRYACAHWWWYADCFCISR